MKVLQGRMWLLFSFACLSAKPITVTDTQERSMDVEVLAHNPSIGNLKRDVEENPVIGKELLNLAEGSLVEKDLAARKR